jgi:hypothetical protein
MQRCTLMVVLALVFRAGAAVAVEQSGIGGYTAAVTADNRLKYTLAAADFTFTRISAANSTETEIAIAGPNEAPVVIRFGGPGGLSVERGGQMVMLRHGETDDKLEAIAALLNGRGVTAFRALVGSYERDLMNDAATLGAKTSPFAYSLLLTAAFVSELAGDPNAMARTRELIRRRIAAGLRAAAWRKVDCVTDYERALLANDTRNTQCMESADNLESFWDRAGARLLCSAEFLAGALSAETQFISCSGLSPLKIQ